VSDPRERDSGNTILAKEFPGGVLVVTGANSSVGLRSMPARFLLMDEVDAYPPSASTGAAGTVAVRARGEGKKQVVLPVEEFARLLSEEVRTRSRVPLI